MPSPVCMMRFPVFVQMSFCSGMQIVMLFVGSIHRMTTICILRSRYNGLSASQTYEAHVVFSTSADVNMNGYPNRMRLTASGVHVWPPSPWAPTPCPDTVLIFCISSSNFP